MKSSTYTGMVEDGGLVLLSCKHMSPLASRVCSTLHTNHGAPSELLEHMEIEHVTHPVGEVMPVIPRSVRRKEVFLFHSFYYPDINTAFMEILLTIDALRRADVRGLTLVLPFMAYLRQDRKHMGRVPISARVIADAFEMHGTVERLITVDMHAAQEQGFFTIPVNDLSTYKLFAADVHQKFDGDLSNTVGCAADIGGSKRVANFVKAVDGGMGLSIINKNRDESGTSAEHIIGSSVEGKDVVLFDDMVDTAGTQETAVLLLNQFGAKSITSYNTHILHSEKEGLRAEDKLRKSGITEVVGTDSIPRSIDYLQENEDFYRSISLDGLLAETINESVLRGGSISQHFA